MWPIIRCVAEPLQVAVYGRDGVGGGTVAAALADTGVGVVSGSTGAEVQVVVIAEALKPEDRAVLADSTATGTPTLTVLNKADLMGVGGGRLRVARRHAAHCRALTGVPTLPLVGLLARTVFDDELTTALRALITEPADLTSTDAFLETDHRVPREVRARLLATLDRFGITHAVLALSRGGDTSSLPTLLRRLSGLGEVVAQLEATAAPVRYRRVRAAVAELRALAVRCGDERLSQFLSSDDTVIAVMAAAVAVVEEAGLTVDRGHQPTAHLRRAVHWRRYSYGPVNALHRGCGADISRGSLRLLRQGR